MTTNQKWTLGLSLAALVAIIYFWDDIVVQWKKWFPGTEQLPKDGEACKTSDNQDGTYKDGVCIPLSGGPGNPGGGSGPGGGGANANAQF